MKSLSPMPKSNRIKYKFIHKISSFPLAGFGPRSAKWSERATGRRQLHFCRLIETHLSS